MFLKIRGGIDGAVALVCILIAVGVIVPRPPAQQVSTEPTT